MLVPSGTVIVGLPVPAAVALPEIRSRLGSALRERDGQTSRRCRLAESDLPDELQVLTDRNSIGDVDVWSADCRSQIVKPAGS